MWQKKETGMEQVSCEVTRETTEHIATERMSDALMNETDRPDVSDVPPTFAPNGPPTESHAFCPNLTESDGI